MAAKKSYYARPSYRFLPNYREHHNPLIAHDSVFELDESNIFDSPEFLMPSPAASRLSKKPSSKPSRASSADRSVIASTITSSLPVNIPDWSKILRAEYRENHREEGVDYDDDDDDEGEEGEEFEKGVRVPPHEFLARTRIASFSVHEGMGRTLKGRDLSRVRNAIWEKTGFQD